MIAYYFVYYGVFVTWCGPGNVDSM